MSARTVLAALLVVAAGARADHGAVSSRVLAYQGVLDHDGVPYDGVVQMTFSLYDAPTGGALLDDHATDVDVVNGRFSVLIGPLVEAVFDAATLYVEIAVDGTTLNTRQLIVAAPAAHKSAAAPTFPVEALLRVETGTATGGDNTARFAAPAIGPQTSHVHWGVDGDWYIRSAKSGGKVVVQDGAGPVTIGTATPSGTAKLTVAGNVAVAGTVTSACRAGFTAVADGRLCIDATTRAPAPMISGSATSAINVCKSAGPGSRVCNHNDLIQACGGGVDPFAGRNTSFGYWMSDLVGDDAFMTVNSYSCAGLADNVTNPAANGITGTAAYRCCY